MTMTQPTHTGATMRCLHVAAWALLLGSCGIFGTMSVANAQLSADDNIINSSLPEISYVLDPFERQTTTELAWFGSAMNGTAGPNITLNYDDFLFGAASLRVEFSYDQAKSLGSSNADSSMTVGWLQPDKPHNCFDATHISLWYKALPLAKEKEKVLTNTSTTVSFKLTLLDDSHCDTSSRTGFCPMSMVGMDTSNLEHYSYTTAPAKLATSSESLAGWQEIRVNIEDFALGVSVGALGNGQLDLNRLRGWHVELILADAAGTSGNSTTNKGATTVTVLFDQLTCVGGGDLLGSSLRPLGNVTWEDLVSEELWIEEYYQSNYSRDNSHITLEDGRMTADYTVQTVETWGGFVGLTTLAPGEAYWNLTGATDWHLSYHTRLAASSSDRTHLRLVVSEVSDCTDNCSSVFADQERWYSFNFILDDNVTNDGRGEIFLPLVGSREPTTPFWLTGWNGDIGNGELDISHIKGYTLEFNIDGEVMNSTVSGGLDLFNMSALAVMYNTTTAEGDDISGSCVAETDLYLRENSVRFQRHDFLGSECCQVCQQDETCLYALNTGWDCFTASYIEAGMVGILSTEIMQTDLKAFWIDDPVRRGDFCDLCTCAESDRSIDCRGRDLMIVPKSFYHDIEAEISWMPRMLDLRNNSKLVLLGAGSLDSIATELEELWLPKELRHISQSSLSSLPKLSSVYFEETQEVMLSNVIVEPTGAFEDVCCSPGTHVDVSSPVAGFTFCDMMIDVPGVDAKYLPFIEFPEATQVRLLTPSSSFMSEASDSLDKCAEYCAVSGDCKYFSYDARLPNAEHMCLLLSDNGTGAFEVCCDADHYADDAGTLPGWTSGLPPRTRHKVDNARVLLEPNIVVADSSNDYSAVFEVSLGSAPLRGAVWIEPTLVSVADLEVSFFPSRVVLYDAKSSVQVTVKISNLRKDSKAVSLVVKNVIKSCDAAFMESSDAVANQETTLFIDVLVPETDSGANVVMVVTVSVAAVLLVALGIFFYIERKRKLNDYVWKVKPEELTFDDPPEVLGRGSFGLVLKASYRGTEVAVKRVIPPREKTSRTGKQRSSSVGSASAFDSSAKMMASRSLNQKSSVSNSVMIGSKSQLSKWNNVGVFAVGSGEDASYKKLKADFMKEMRYLSKLRHPAITTVMGAVISSKAEPMLIMEYMDHGSLYDLLHNETVVIEGELFLPLLRDITQGVRFLHSCDPAAIHGDLKAANILVDSRFRAKVADFGMLKKRAGATGTPYWMAPELLRGESLNSTASDVYSFGIILYEVYSRSDPYEGEDSKEVVRLVMDKLINKRPVPRHMPAAIQSIMNDCLVSDPEQRPSFNELDQRLKRADAKNVEPTNFQQKQTGNISLFDIFPRHIAKALQEGRKVEPEHKDCVTIFFSDIVSFTEISSTLDPRKVANMLDRLYHKLDDLSEKHDLYKVETIGDAYMCCGNLVKDQPETHVKRIAEFSIEAIAAANTTPIDLENPALGFVDIRVGFHSGPVVADVVGNRNPRFCLFGDTVNVASRMESKSKPGRIHCSKAAADLLAKQAPLIPLTSRGIIIIKGKGDMHTFWVNKDGASSSTETEVLPESAPGQRMLDYSMNNIAEEHSGYDLEQMPGSSTDNVGEEHCGYAVVSTEDESNDAQSEPFVDRFADEAWVPGSFVDV